MSNATAQREQIEATESHTYELQLGYFVTIDIHDTQEQFRWMLTDSDGCTTGWTKSYESMLILEGRVGKVGMVTYYYERDFTFKLCFCPFLIKFGRRIGDLESPK